MGERRYVGRGTGEGTRVDTVDYVVESVQSHLFALLKRGGRGSNRRGKAHGRGPSARGGGMFWEGPRKRGEAARWGEVGRSWCWHALHSTGYLRLSRVCASSCVGRGGESFSERSSTQYY